MDEQEFIAQRRKDLEASVEYFAPQNKNERERCLGITRVQPFELSSPAIAQKRRRTCCFADDNVDAGHCWNIAKGIIAPPGHSETLNRLAR